MQIRNGAAGCTTDSPGAQAGHIGTEPSHSIRHATARLTNTIHIVQARARRDFTRPGQPGGVETWNWDAHQHQVGLDALLSRIRSHYCARLHGLLLLNQLVWESATQLCSHPGNLPWHHYDSCLLGLGLPVQLEPPGPGPGPWTSRCAHSFLSTISSSHNTASASRQPRCCSSNLVSKTRIACMTDQLRVCLEL